MKAFVFPGQGAQFSGMGKDLYDNYDQARTMMLQANDILGFSLTDVMFEGSDEDLKQTRVTQPAIFLHSIISARLMSASMSAIFRRLRWYGRTSVRCWVWWQRSCCMYPLWRF